MAGQSCPNEGKDSRLFGRWGCRIQTALSFHSTLPPASVRVEFPCFFALNVPLARLPAPRFFTFRIGFRWDPNWAFDDGSGRMGGYIFPEAIIKVLDHTV